VAALALIVVAAAPTSAALASYRTATNHAAGNGPRSVAVADLNGDVRPDLAVANSGSNSVSVLLGNGDGTFAPATKRATGNGIV
jgi:hypothetical protein